MNTDKNQDSQRPELEDVLTYPDVALIKNTKNLGYVRAVNQGINQGPDWDVEYVWICNNDVVVHEDALVHLVEIDQSDTQIEVVAPVVYSNN